MFTEAELEYLSTQKLGRLATAQPDGTLQASPVSFGYNPATRTIDIGGYHMAASRKFRNVAAGSTSAPPGGSTSAGRGSTARERLGAGLTAFFGFVAAHRDGWTVLYRQARGQDPFAEVIASLRARMAELIVGGLTAAARAPVDPADLATLALIVLGAAEELADRIVAGPDLDTDPAVLAAHLTRILWLGAGPLLGEDPF
jgi:AcrR family transcriptional regulator